LRHNPQPQPLAQVDMDLPSLAVVLRAALSHVPEERKAAEESLNQVSASPPPIVSSPDGGPQLLLSIQSPLRASWHCLIASR